MLIKMIACCHILDCKLLNLGKNYFNLAVEESNSLKLELFYHIIGGSKLFILWMIMQILAIFMTFLSHWDLI